MTKLVDSGFERTRLAGRIKELYGKARAIFGQEIDLSSDTMDGQHLGLFAEAISDIDELAELVWQSFDADLATGASLDRIVKINGIERKQGGYSRVQLLIRANAGVKIPKGTIFYNARKNLELQTLNDVEGGTIRIFDTLEEEALGLMNGTAVYAVPLRKGAIYVAPDTKFKVKSPVYGVGEAHSNGDALAIVGSAKETDRELRLRRRNSVTVGGGNTLNNIYKEVSKIEGVTEINIIENTTDKIDNKGTPPHSLQIMVLGGNTADVAKAIWDSKSAGTNLVGTSGVKIKDAIGNDQSVFFTIPTIKPIRVEVNITPAEGWSYRTQNEIRSIVIDFINNRQKIGKDFLASSLYSPLLSVEGFIINEIKVCEYPGYLYQQSVTVMPTERVNISVEDINLVQS